MTLGIRKHERDYTQVDLANNGNDIDSVLILSSAPVFARNFQHPAYARFPYFSGAPYYQPYSYPYVGRPYPNYSGPGGLQGYYSGYVKPRIYMRGRVNRFGDYHIDIKLRGLSQYDLHKAWRLFQQYGYR